MAAKETEKRKTQTKAGTAKKKTSVTKSKSTVSAKRKTALRKKKKGAKQISGFNGIGKYTNYVIGAAVILVLILLICLGVRGCSGVKNNSPQKVVCSLIESGTAGKENRMKQCYGLEKNSTVSSDLQTEIEATIRYYNAHNLKKVQITKCDVIASYAKYSYVYATYNLILENEQSYPCIGTYMVGKKENGYYVMPASEITEEMSQQATGDYVKFMTTDVYKNYMKDYDTFMKRNPGYEDKIAGKML